MSKKILVVGGVAGGASAAARLRRLNEKDQIIIFERGVHVSFSNCSLPYRLSDVVSSPEALVLLEPSDFASQYNIDVRVRNEVLSIDRAAKEVLVKNHLSGDTYIESYDKLILSPGAQPITPAIKGLDLINHFTLRNVVDIETLHQFLKSRKPANVIVVGGGFIGIETAENINMAGHKVTVIEAAPQILRQFDFDMVQILHKELYDHGIPLLLGDGIQFFEKDTVVLQSGKKLHVQAVVFATGIRPETVLAEEAQLEIGFTGAIKVDSNNLTTDKDIYAIGDAIELYGSLFKDTFTLPLAGPAQKQARQAADHIHGLPVVNRGYIGSSIIKVCGKNAAATGLSEAFIKSRRIDVEYDTVKVIPSDMVSLMPDSNVIHFKLLYEKSTGKVLGAQAIGNGNVDKRIDVIATLIKMNGTIDDLKDLELCYAPPFGTAKDVVNFAGYVASNRRKDTFKQVHDYQIRELVEAGSLIIDVRGKEQYELSHIFTAKNIPFEQIRTRISELPKKRPLFIHCRTGLDSYNVVLMLQQLGFVDVYNIAGGFLGISYYEFFTDQTTGRKPILTGYNFN
ncbi:MAG: NADPH-dependent 2,4-dienoyl-CoA reductase/sulfur reductase-like enzyme [Desulforhopalus sp.]|jgi:NADPH-dependent 2,4-dienoyl-CoA reductase/sulfur reductase-like enzyme/rhodanese-related sulfurtransferase